MRRRRRAPLEATGGLETVAVRVPDRPVALALLKDFGGGVTAPSANRFGQVSPTTADDVRAELGDAVGFVLDGGPCQVGVESTIVDATGGTPSIVRSGGVTREDLKAVLERPLAVHSTIPVRVPGQHPSHYAPRARVVLVEPEKVIAEAERAQDLGHQVGRLSASARLRRPGEGARRVRIPGSMAAYTRGLYGYLRELDQRGCDLIVASLPVEEDSDWRSPTGCAPPRGPGPPCDQHRCRPLNLPCALRASENSAWSAVVAADPAPARCKGRRRVCRTVRLQSGVSVRSGSPLRTGDLSRCGRLVLGWAGRLSSPGTIGSLRPAPGRRAAGRWTGIGSVNHRETSLPG
ncbi:L-threonylcarbamoyladenylate synthase [Streptomyces olivaceoviridis]